MCRPSRPFNERRRRGDSCCALRCRPLRARPANMLTSTQTINCLICISPACCFCGHVIYARGHTRRALSRARGEWRYPRCGSRGILEANKSDCSVTPLVGQAVPGRPAGRPSGRDQRTYNTFLSIGRRRGVDNFSASAHGAPALPFHRNCYRLLASSGHVASFCPSSICLFSPASSLRQRIFDRSAPDLITARRYCWPMWLLSWADVLIAQSMLGN